MQLKKRELQMTIQKTALEMFYKEGYLKTKMSDIAKEMDMSVGNIYTYFKNKEELFYTVVPEETIFYFEEVILTTIKTYNDVLVNQKESEEFFELIEKQMALITGNYREVVIMLDKNEGTIYEGMKERLITEMTEDRVLKGKTYTRFQKMSDQDLRLFYKIIGHGFLDMILMALKEENLSDEEKYRLCMSLITYQLKKSETS
ncbi:TetR/AcrR family transcriptional regulator [Vagococcus fluvialis]|nr:TetR/AcrR family transcriptional regulator [Vagococcus fluvialis]MDT2780688.1 TetR/AcrR family transcriptional regulator [Vagococcus fluvialis]